MLNMHHHNPFIVFILWNRHPKISNTLHPNFKYPNPNFTNQSKSFFVREGLSQWFASQQGDVSVVGLACSGEKHHGYL